MIGVFGHNNELFERLIHSRAANETVEASCSYNIYSCNL